MNKQPKAIIFDMDGLMIDTERLYFETEREMVADYGKTVDEKTLTKTLWKMMGRSPLDAVTIIINELDLPAEPAEFLKRRDIIMESKMENDLLPMKGLFEILDEFQGRLKLAIATGAMKNFLDFTVDKLNIRERFDVLQTSDEITNGKPHPEIYITTARKLGIAPEFCVVLEDSSNGTLAGKDAGCYSIAVPSEYTQGQDFSFADYVAEDLLDAKRHILGMGR